MEEQFILGVILFPLIYLIVLSVVILHMLMEEQFIFLVICVVHLIYLIVLSVVILHMLMVVQYLILD